MTSECSAKEGRVGRDLATAFNLRKTGGAEGIRTPDPHNAIVVLYQLSYDPSQKTEEL